MDSALTADRCIRPPGMVSIPNDLRGNDTWPSPTPSSSHGIQSPGGLRLCAMSRKDRFREAYDLASNWIEQRFGLPVVITDVTDPFTGDLDGERILVDYDLEA